MDHTEFLRKIKADLPGEISGIKEYVALSKAADEDDMDCWAAMLKQMAWEKPTKEKHWNTFRARHNVSF
jgi:hypothetical protein